MEGFYKKLSTEDNMIRR